MTCGCDAPHHFQAPNSLRGAQATRSHSCASVWSRNSPQLPPAHHCGGKDLRRHCKSRSVIADATWMVGAFTMLSQHCGASRGLLHQLWHSFWSTAPCAHPPAWLSGCLSRAATTLCARPQRSVHTTRSAMVRALSWSWLWHCPKKQNQDQGLTTRTCGSRSQTWNTGKGKDRREDFRTNRAVLAEAHSQIPIHPRDCHLLGCQMETRGVASASYYWSRTAPSVGRLAICIPAARLKARVKWLRVLLFVNGVELVLSRFCCWCSQFWFWCLLQPSAGVTRRIGWLA